MNNHFQFVKKKGLVYKRYECSLRQTYVLLYPRQQKSRINKIVEAKLVILLVISYKQFKLM